MKRRTVLLEVEIEGGRADPIALRDAILGWRASGWGTRVVHVEIKGVSDDGTRSARPVRA
jgi:hypothetical protein